jgi:hypothetical protein
MPDIMEQASHLELKVIWRQTPEFRCALQAVIQLRQTLGFRRRGPPHQFQKGLKGGDIGEGFRL